MRVSSSLSQMEPMSFGRVLFDSATARTMTLNASIPTYQVEHGPKISDGVLKDTLVLEVSGIFSAMPLTHRGRNGYGINNVQDRIDMLMGYFYSGSVMTFYSDSRTYYNMIIESLSVPETVEMRNAVEVSMTLKQIRVVGNVNYILDTYEGETGVEAETRYFRVDVDTKQNPAVSPKDTGKTENAGVAANSLAYMRASAGQGTITYAASKTYGGLNLIQTQYLMHNIW